MLEVNRVDQCFRTGFWMRKTQVLHDVTLSIPKKSVFGFLGANGAGKTTLIHLIVGLKRQTRGWVKIAGYEAHTPQAKARVGYLPERPYFYEHLTGQEFLFYVGALSGMDHSQVQAKIPQIFSRVGLSNANRLELRRYSKGMLQRIGLAQAILHDPEFLVLDEPMSGLDPVGRKEIRDLLVQLASEGKTIFFSSHIIPDVEAICDQVAMIEKGRLIGCGPIGQFLAMGKVQTEIAFKGVSLSEVEKFTDFESIRQIPDGIRAMVSSQEAVSRALALLLRARAQILWVTPVRPSLESFFEKEVSHG